MIELKVECVENGFIVTEGNHQQPGVMGRSWAFESAESLSKFVLKWASDNEKPTIIAKSD